jgi:hypothetical protein
MTLDKQLWKTDKMVKRVMAAHAPPLNLTVSEPFLDYIDTNVLFDLDWWDWARFFAVIMLVSFAAGLAYGGAVISYEYLLVCP